jgi:hypothetical protein
MAAYDRDLALCFFFRVGFPGESAGDFAGERPGDFAGESSGDFAGERPGDFAGESSGDFPGERPGDRSALFSNARRAVTLMVFVTSWTIWASLSPSMAASSKWMPFGGLVFMFFDSV